MAKLMTIRRDDRCASCGRELAAGTTAVWSRAERVVRCVECVDPSALDVPAEPAAAVGDVAGASAQREYDKRSARESARKQAVIAEDERWRAAAKAERPILGRLASAVTPRPRVGPESHATAAWKVGAAGERRVAEVLATVGGIDVLHDRRVPGSRANIDHLAVGPAGVYVIDAKKYTGRVERRDAGGLFRTDERLYVNGRDRTKLVEGVLGQVEVVRAALADEFAHVEVRGVLCFVGCEWGLVMRAKRVRGVTALWPLALADHVTAPGPLAGSVQDIGERLRARLRPAG